MDEGSGSGEHGRVSTEDGGVSLTLLTVGLLGGHSGEVGPWRRQPQGCPAR